MRMVELTDRQYDVVVLLAEGKTYKVIGRALGISHSTVRTHAASAYAKLDVSNAAQAVAAVMQLRGISPPRPRAQVKQRISRRRSTLAETAPFLHAYLALWERAGRPVPGLIDLGVDVDARDRRAMRVCLSLHMQTYRSR